MNLLKIGHYQLVLSHLRLQQMDLEHRILTQSHLIVLLLLLLKEHISGKEYVQYLEALVQIYNLKIDQHTNVLDVSNNIDKDTYKIYTDQGTIDAEYIFVATGIFHILINRLTMVDIIVRLRNFQIYMVIWLS